MRNLIIGICLFSSCAFAGVDNELHFYAEPDVGYTTGRFKATGEDPNTGNPIDQSSAINGLSPGLMLGWRADYAHVFLGGHYNVLSSDEIDGTISVAEYGLGFGIEWNIPFMTSLMVQKSTFSSENINLDGLGFKFGLSLFVTKNVKLNLMYANFRAIEEDVKYSNTTVTAGISLPFDINYPTELWRDRRYGSEMHAPASSVVAPEEIEDSIEDSDDESDEIE